MTNRNDGRSTIERTFSGAVRIALPLSIGSNDNNEGCSGYIWDSSISVDIRFQFFFCSAFRQDWRPRHSNRDLFCVLRRMNKMSVYCRRHSAHIDEVSRRRHTHTNGSDSIPFLLINVNLIVVINRIEIQFSCLSIFENDAVSSNSTHHHTTANIYR